MKKVSRYTLTAIMLALFVAGAVLVIATNQRVFSDKPLATELLFFHPNSAYLGPGGSYAVTDSGGRRLICADNSDTIAYILDGSRGDSTTMPNYSILGFQKDGYLLALESMTNIAEATVERQNIILISPTGNSIRVIYSISYTKEQRADYTYSLYYAQAERGTIHFFYPVATGEYKLSSIDLEGKSVAEDSQVIDVSKYQYCAIPASDEAFFLGKGGDIYRWNLKLSPTLWRKNEARGPTGILVPLSLQIDQRGNFYILDGKRRVWTLSGGILAEDPIASQVRRLNGGKASMPYIGVGADGAFAAPEETSSSVFIRPSGGETRGIKSVHYPISTLIRRILAYASGLIGAAAFVLFWIFFFRHGYKGRLPLILKQLLVFLPFIVAAIATISILMYGNTHANFEKEVRRRLLSMAQMGASAIDANKVSSLAIVGVPFKEYLESTEYAYLSDFFKKVVNDNQDWWNSSTYTYIYKKITGDWYTVGSYDYTELYPYDRPEFTAVLEGGSPRTFTYSDVWGAWYSGIAPVVGNDGKIVAVFEAVMNDAIFKEFDRNFAHSVSWSIAVAAAVLMLVFSIFTYFVLASLKALMASAQRIRDGDYSVDVNIRSRDELSDLGIAFNTMSAEIKARIDQITKLNEANSRFVPHEFLTFLGKASITDVQLGDQVMKEMSVMFADIRSFSGIAETLSPEATFGFLNSYLGKVGPAVKEHGGFIDKYLGDSIMALFPRRPKDAIDAALLMISTLENFNLALAESGRANSLDPIRIGIGLHTGLLMLGIIGEEERFDGTVISDAVNVAARLEGLTKQYGVGILASEETLRASGTAYESRFLDRVRVLGKFEAIRIFEIIAPCDPARKHKLETATIFGKAHALYQGKRFEEAQSLFTRLARRCPDDYAAILFMRRCARFARDGTPPNWDGTIELREK